MQDELSFDRFHENVDELYIVYRTELYPRADDLNKSFNNVGCTGMMMEDFGVDHVHTKLFPLHRTGEMKNWKPIQ